MHVFDFRRDIQNLVITPEIRARFMRMEPGETAVRHSHDLGHEVFLVLEGQAEFEIEGERAVLGPGQFCFARADEMHQVRNVGDGPMILYLSVTPHCEPTHTFWEDDRKLPPRYGGSLRAGAGDVAPARRPLAPLARELVGLSTTLADQAAALDDRLLAGEKDAADAIWAAIYPTCKALSALVEAWNANAVATAAP